MVPGSVPAAVASTASCGREGQPRNACKASSRTLPGHAQPDAGGHILNPVVQATEEATAAAGLGAAAGLNIEADFKHRVQDMAKPGTSLLRVVIRQVTMDNFPEALAPYGGTVLKTSLPHGAEEQLMKALHSPDSIAPTREQSPAPAAAGGSAQPGPTGRRPITGRRRAAAGAASRRGPRGPAAATRGLDLAA